MSASSHRLAIEAADDTAEITVLDGNLNRAVRGIGKVKQDLPAGIYKIRIRVGPTRKEQLLALDQDRDIKIETLLKFPSPIPLKGTSRSHEYHIDAAQQASAKREDALGVGASVLVFAREWTSDGLRSQSNPAAGLSFLDWTGQVRVDVGSRAELHPSTDLKPDPSAGWCADVKPGAYRLRLDLPDGTALERAVFASPGQQTQVFLLQSDYPGSDHEPVRGPDLEGAVITISSAGAFWPDNRHARFAELARYALTQSRRFLSDDMLDEFLVQKFEDPMLGLLGALLLLRDRPDDAALFHTVTGNLLELLGSDQPDLRALWLRRKDPTGLDDVRLLSPPMLRHSWDLAVDESFEREDLIPLGTPSGQIADKILPTSPWLVWRAGSQEDATGRDLSQDRIGALADALGDYLGAQARQKAARLKAVPKSIIRRVGTAVYDWLPRSVAAHLPTIGEAASTASEAAPAALDINIQKELSRTLGVPRHVLETMLKRDSH